MPKSKVFIIQEKETTISDIEALLRKAGLEVVGTAVNGEDGVRGVIKSKPDLVIVEMILAGIDGLEVMERINEFAPGTLYLVLSSLTTEGAITRAIMRGACYYMAKPYNSELLLERVKDILKGEREEPTGRLSEMFARQDNRLEEKISKIFISVGIPPHIKGYSYLREGVKMAVGDPEIINCITKRLYPGIGAKYATSASKVERAIRHAIEVAWNRERVDSINSVFGVRAYVGSEKPTNGEFIALIADKMLLEGVS